MLKDTVVAVEGEETEGQVGDSEGGGENAKWVEVGEGGTEEQEADI